jgi:hypothetical protein
LYCNIPRRCQLIDCCILVSPPRQFLRRPSSPVVNVELANSLFIFASFVYYFGTSAPRRASTTSVNNNNNDDAIDSSAGSVPLKGRAGHGANFSFWGSMGSAPDLAGWLWPMACFATHFFVPSPSVAEEPLPPDIPVLFSLA